MIRRLLPLLLIAACARSAAPARPVPDLHARNDSRYPGNGFIIVVDGVQHSDSSFRALGLTPEQIDSVQVCKDYCPGPAMVIYTNRAASRRPPE
jgi:hypothetical protein